MNNSIKAAVLGATGYVGLELIKILSNHPKVQIKFLGSETPSKNISEFDNHINSSILPKLEYNNNFNPTKIDVVFLALPHGISHKYVKKYFNYLKIIDLSADFRLDKREDYIADYKDDHSCTELLNKFVYGLPELYENQISITNNLAVPGCYPTSILLPLIPLLKNNLIKGDNIIIDSKSGYSGAGKKFDKNNIQKGNLLNFYNYNTNNHRHIGEIYQELQKQTNQEINFSFNPHILPIYRGMLSTIYCDLNEKIHISDIENCLNNTYQNTPFVHHMIGEERGDFFLVQNTNNCYIKLQKHSNSSKIIIVSLIDNLLKGASGQAVQCMNIMFDLKQITGLESHK